MIESKLGWLWLSSCILIGVALLHCNRPQKPTESPRVKVTPIATRSGPGAYIYEVDGREYLGVYNIGIIALDSCRTQCNLPHTECGTIILGSFSESGRERTIQP